MTRDGQRFLVAEPRRSCTMQPIEIIVNWQPSVKEPRQPPEAGHALMQLRERQQDSITILHASGTMTEADKDEMRATIARLLDAGRTRLVLDLAQLTYMDSAALGELVACQIRVGRAGATLKLAGAARRLNDLLVITRLITVFDAYDSLQAALESFNEDD